MVTMESMPMAFIWAAASGGILEPLISEMFISKRDLPASKIILPGTVIMWPVDGSGVAISNRALNVWLSPNNLDMAPPKCGPPPPPPGRWGCAWAVASARMVNAVRRNVFFMAVVIVGYQMREMRQSVEQFFSPVPGRSAGIQVGADQLQHLGQLKRFFPVYYT